MKKWSKNRFKKKKGDRKISEKIGEERKVSEKTRKIGRKRNL